MATYTKFDLPQYGYLSTDSQMQQFFTAYTGFMQSNGFERTSDTGQFDPATASGTGTQYEIRKFSGSQVSGSPIYVKLSWGNRCSTLNITLGTGSNGSGTILNQFGAYAASFNLLYTGNNGGLLMSIGDDEYVSFSFYVLDAGTPKGLAFSIGRSVDATDSSVTGDWAALVGGFTAGYSGQYYEPLKAYDYNTGVKTEASDSSYHYFNIGASPKPLEVVILRRMWFNWLAPYPYQHAITGYEAEVPLGSEVTVSNVGSAEVTYRGTVAGKNSRLMLRWE